MAFCFFPCRCCSASLVGCSLFGFGCNGVSGKGQWRCQPCRSYSGKTWPAPTRTFPAMLSPVSRQSWCGPGWSTGQYRVLRPCGAFGQVISSDGKIIWSFNRRVQVHARYGDAPRHLIITNIKCDGKAAICQCEGGSCLGTDTMYIRYFCNGSRTASW